MNEIKFMCIYMDNSCEVHYDSSDNAKLILSSCGSSFVFRTYAENVIKNTLKYRTAYAISMFSEKLTTVLRERNRFCNDRPFISPILLENDSSYWFSPEDLSKASWDVTPINLNIKNPIEIDYNDFFYVWKSDCKNSLVKVHFNKRIFVARYPVRLPVSENDDYERNCDNYNNFKLKAKTPSSKHIRKYTWNEQEFSTSNLPPLWEEIYAKMIQLADQFLDSQQSKATTRLCILDKQDSSNLKKSEIIIKFPEAMPLSCSSTHLHRFDNIETTSEAKVIYTNKAWFKFLYKTKSIEILCPFVKDQNVIGHETCSNSFDYLVSDSPTGRYFSCLSLNKRSGDVEEVKICSDNIPSFKVYLKSIINYAQIFLKRINSIKVLSNSAICYMQNKLAQIEQIPDKKFNVPSVSIEEIKIKQASSSANVSMVSNLTESVGVVDSNIKRQYVIENVGHFKYLRNNNIVIYFIDKVKLHMDEYSLKKYLENDLDKCSCCVFLPDSSQHDVQLRDSCASLNCFKSYTSFLEQWIGWLVEAECIVDYKLTKNEESTNEINVISMQAHLNNLKLFNYTRNQDINPCVKNNETDKCIISNQNPPKEMSVSSLLNENNRFLKNIGL